MAEQMMKSIHGDASVMKKRVVCPYRVSTIGQVEKDDIPMQKQYCREFRKRLSGWGIVNEFSEKGVSGFKISAKDRDAVQEIQKMALKGELFYKTFALPTKIFVWYRICYAVTIITRFI